jgi:phospholipase C
MLENHSFDQMLRCMKEIYPHLEGVDVARDDVHQAPDYPDRGHFIPQLHIRHRIFDPDPVHEHINVLRQLNPEYGYIVDYLQAYPHVSFEKKSEVMGIYPRGFLPVLHTLAEHYAICDHWYSSLSGPTWPNRFFIHSGTANGHVKMPNGVSDKNWHVYDQVTVYDRLSENEISWKIYHHGMPQSLVMLHQLRHADHYHNMQAFFQDAGGQTLAGLSAQPPRSHCSHGLLHGPNYYVLGALYCFFYHRPRSKANLALQRHQAPDEPVDRPAVTGSVSVRVGF